MTQLVKSVSFPLYYLKPGKPDPSIGWEDGQERPRVVQTPQKGPNCSYYAMRKLSKHIGKNHPPKYHKDREFERQCSLLNKNTTSLSDYLSLINGKREIINYISNTFILKYSHVEASKYRPCRDIISKHLPIIRKFLDELIKDEKTFTNEQADAVHNFFTKFCEQMDCDDLNNFNDAYFRAEFVRIHAEFFQSLKIQPENGFKNYKKLLFFSEFCNQKKSNPPQPLIISNEILDPLFKPNFTSWESALLQEKFAFFENFRTSVVLQTLNFKITPWTPNNPIDDFIKQLIARGPFFVIGKFGKGYYKNPPSLLKKIEDRNIYCWKQGDRKEDSPQSSDLDKLHAIIVIGAQEVKGGGFVYYVDPEDKSDPAKPEEEKIYVVSYRTFTEHVNKAPHTSQNPQTFVQLIDSSSPFAYAFYHDKNTAS